MIPLPASMTAIEITEHGGPEVLSPVSRPVPRPIMGEVLIKVKAAGVNQADLLQRAGSYPPPPGASDIPGMEVTGTILECGFGVHGLAIGDEVCALIAGGGYAEYAVAPAGQCLPVPRGFSPEEAASLPEATFTVWSNVVDRGALKSGETVLIHGGTSGIGVFAIQYAKALGARVFTTAGSDDKVRFCEELGAEKGINYQKDDFVKVIKELTNKHGADVILDMVGGDYVQRNLTLAARDGRIVNIAFAKGSRVEVDLKPIMLKRLTLTGSTLRARTIHEKAVIAHAVKLQIWPLIENGTIKPIIDKIFPLRAAADAHRLMVSSAHKGKIVLTVPNAP